jgi:hypothetical protein
MAAACQPALALTPASSTAPTASAMPVAPAATPQAAASALAPAVAPADDITGLGGYAWDDRSPFRAGLVQSQRSVLDGLPDAPIYHIAVTVTQGLDAVQGVQAMRYTNAAGAPLAEVVFHLFPNLLAGSLSVSDVTAAEQPVAARLDQHGTILRVPLAQPLPPGGNVVIGMSFTAAVPHDITRNYGVLSFNQDVLALSHFFPLVAEYDQRGWDTEIPMPYGDLTYSDAAFFLVRVRAPAAPVVAGPGIVLDSQNGGGDQLLTFAIGPARDFYLSLSPDYAVITDTAGEVRVNSYAPKGAEAESRSALAVAEAALADYDAHYGPYPYTTFNLAATSTTALGIEYPGMVAITLREYDPNADFGGTPVTLMRETTVAHEVAHQWFYNLVGDNQLDEPWLDEALAQYVSWRYYARRYGPGADQGYRQSLQARWQRGDKPDMPIGLPVSAYTGGEYSAIVYGRGPLFFDALDQQIGQPAMDAFLSSYVQAYQWKNATTTGLKQAAEQACRCDLTALFQTWVNPDIR